MRITTRLALMASTLVVTSAFLIGFTLYQTSEETLISNAKSTLNFAISHAGHDLHDSANAVSAQVLFLSKTPAVLDLASGTLDAERLEQRKSELATEFAALARYSPDILQIRLISAADNGRELVRINQIDGKIETVPDAQLQEKGMYDYVAQTLTAARGDTLLFGINLNREFDRIEVPYVPVLRVSTPIFSPYGAMFGLIVININMQSVFDRMKTRFPSPASFYLANAKGEILLHPDPSKQFLFEFGHPYKLVDEFPELKDVFADALPDAAFIRELGDNGEQLIQVSQETIGTSPWQQLYIAAAMIPKTAVGTGLDQHSWIFILTLGLSLAGALVAIGISRHMLRPLNDLTVAADRVAAGENVKALAIVDDRDDEVGHLGRSFGAMALALNERQVNIEEKEARLRAIFEAVGNPILTIDGDGIIQRANMATGKLFGYTQDELIGHNVSMLMNPVDRAQHDQYLNEHHRTDRATIIGIGREVEARTKDGTPIPIHLAVSKVQLKDRLMFTGVMTDLRERKKVERLKNEFVSTVSHELRTPLTSIRGSLSLMKSSVLGQLPEPLQKMVEIADSNANRLSRLINDILDIEKIEAGKLTFHLSRLDIAEFTARMVEANEGYARNHDVKLVNGGCPDGIKLTADPDRLAQVVSNLISNAIKFTPPGGTVTLSVRVVGQSARFEVQDQGPGIPEEFKDKIFSKFAQADSSDTRSHGGTGLGLAISRAIIVAHGGDIGFESKPDAGTIFYFDLPLRQLSRGGNRMEADHPIKNIA